MKLLFTIFIFCCVLSLYGQKSNNLGHFKITYYDNKTKILKLKFDTATIYSKLDLDFYSKRFYVPYHYPKLLIDNRFKDTTIETWIDTGRQKDFKTNWTFTLRYDSLSRVIKYDYSGCLVCSQFPYHLSLFYDTKSRLIKIESKMNLDISMKKETVYKLSKPRQPEDEFYFKYDIYDNIIQIKHFRFGKLEKQIDKV